MKGSEKMPTPIRGVYTNIKTTQMRGFPTLCEFTQELSIDFTNFGSKSEPISNFTITYAGIDGFTSQGQTFVTNSGSKMAVTYNDNWRSRAYFYDNVNNVVAELTNWYTNGQAGKSYVTFCTAKCNGQNVVLICVISVYNSNIEFIRSSEEFNNAFLSDAGPDIDYNWKSITGIQMGKLADIGFNPPNSIWDITYGGTMLISSIPDDYLNDGEQVTGGEHFVIKPPSIDGWISNYDVQNYTTKALFLKNGNYVNIGRKSVGLGGNEYKFTFLSKFTGNPLLPQITYYDTTVTTALGDGTPYLGFIIDETEEAIKLNVIFVRTLVDQSTGFSKDVVDYNTISMSDSDMHQLFVWFRNSYSFIEHNTPSAENPTQGGDETDPVEGDILNRLELPRLGAVGSGFISLYEVSDAQMQALSAFMWDDSLIANLGRLFEDPREIIVGIMVFPVKPTDISPNTEIMAGNLNTGVFANYLTSGHMRRYCGALRIPKGNSDFMSFAPYRRMHLALPYCEDLELDPSAVYGAVLKLYYYIDFFSGNCVVEITRTFDDGEEEPFMFSKGQIGYQIPISSVDYTRTYTELIKSAFRLASGEAGPVDVLKDYAPKVNYNGGGSAVFGALGSQQPYIVIEEAIPAYDGSQPSYIGNTYYKVRRLGDCNGFTKCFEAHIEGVHATDSELNDIMDWLTKGVIIHPNGGSSTPSDVPSTTGNTVINFMKLSSEVNVIGKIWTDVTPIEGKLIYDQSISEPKILVNTSALGFNYCYIGLFNRFYFVKDTIVRNTDLIEIQLTSDPLESFKDEILNCYASIDRQSQSGNKFIKDPYMWVQANKNVKIMTFKDDGISFDWGHTEDCYILTIAGI